MSLTNQNLLQGENIRLRAVEPLDVDFIYIMENDPSAWHAGNTMVPFSRYQIEQYVLTAEHDIFAEKQLRLMIEVVFQDSSTKNVGAIDVYDFDPQHRRAGVGILIVKEDRKKGYAAEALQILIRYAFTVLNLHQLHCVVSVQNKESLTLFQKNGFIQSGIKREWRFDDGEWIDEVLLQLIKS
jgi:diamine N-acetyltransferase